MEFPKDLKYTEDHEWAKLEEDGTITVGITNYAQVKLGDIVFLDIETEGDYVEQGEVFGSVEAVKTVSELFMPVSGTVLEVNATLEDSPELVNTDPYEAGWLVKIKPSDPTHFEALLSSEAYEVIAV